jgi:hypothetical protein
MEGYRRHGLVHNSQVSEDMAFSREDEDEAKVKAMEFCAPVGSQVALPPLTGVSPAPGSFYRMQTDVGSLTPAHGGASTARHRDGRIAHPANVHIRHAPMAA